MNKSPQTLRGSFSAVSTPIFASKYSLESSWRDLQDSHPFAPLRLHNFSQKSSNFFRKWMMNYSNFSIFWLNKPFAAPPSFARSRRDEGLGGTWQCGGKNPHSCKPVQQWKTVSWRGQIGWAANALLIDVGCWVRCWNAGKVVVCLCCMAEWKKLRKTEQNWAKLSKTGQNYAKLGKTERNWAKLGQTERNWRKFAARTGENWLKLTKVRKTGENWVKLMKTG